MTVNSGTNQDSVAEFDTSGNYLGNFVANGSGGLDGPFDVYPRTADWLVSSINTDNALRYDLAGAFIASLAGINNFPQQVTEASNTNVLIGNFGGTQEGVVELTAAGALVGIYDPASLGGYRGAYELPNGNILTTNGSGVHEIDRSGNLVQTKISGVSGQYIEYVAPQVACDQPGRRAVAQHRSHQRDHGGRSGNRCRCDLTTRLVWRRHLLRQPVHHQQRP